MATNLKLFLKENKKPLATQTYAPTKSITDEKGNPVEWTFKAISENVLEELREQCTRNVPVTGKPGQYIPKINTNKLTRMMIARCVVDPDLQNAELQDSYGVNSAEALLAAMVDLPGEYTNLQNFVSNLCGFDMSMEEKVDEAKN